MSNIDNVFGDIAIIHNIQSLLYSNALYLRMYARNQIKSFGIGMHTISAFNTDRCQHYTQRIRGDTIKSKCPILTTYSVMSKFKIQQTSYIQTRYFSWCIAANRPNSSVLDCRDIHESKVIVLNILNPMYIEIWLFSQNVNPQPGPQLKHELFCCTNPAKFWWARVQSNSDGSQKLNHQNLTGFVLQNNSCPGSSPGSSPTPSHPSHFLMGKTAVQIQLNPGGLAQSEEHIVSNEEAPRSIRIWLELYCKITCVQII